MNEQMLFGEMSTVLQYGIVNIGDMARNNRSFEEQIGQCVSLIVDLVIDDARLSRLYERVTEAGELDRRFALESWSGETAVSLAHHATRQALEQVKSRDRRQSQALSAEA